MQGTKLNTINSSNLSTAKKMEHQQEFYPSCIMLNPEVKTVNIKSNTLNGISKMRIELNIKKIKMYA